MKYDASLGLTFEDEKGRQHFATCRDCHGKSDMLRLGGQSPGMYRPCSFDFECHVGLVRERDRRLVHIEDIIEVPTFQLGLHDSYEVLCIGLTFHEMFFSSVAQQYARPTDLVK